MSQFTAVYHIEEKIGWLDSHRQLASTEFLSPDLVAKIERKCASFMEEYVELLLCRRRLGLTVNTFTYLTPLVDAVTFAASSNARSISSYAVPIDPCRSDDNLVHLLHSHRNIPTIACLEIQPRLELLSESDDDDADMDVDEADPESDEDSVSYHSNFSSWYRANERRCREAAEADSIPTRNIEEENPPISRLAYLQTTSSSGPVLAGFLCLTDTDDISNALSACVLHRWIWGIRDVPVLGLALDSQCGHIVCAVFAHPEPIQGSSCLSVVLWYDPIAFFDLTDSGDVQRLSLLVAAFATQAQAIQQLALPSSTIREALESEHVPYWRVDIAKSVVQSDKKAPIKVQVHKWMDNEEDALCPPVSHLSSDNDQSQLTDSLTQAMDDKKRKPKKEAKSKEVVKKSPPSTTGSSQETKKEATSKEVVGKNPPSNKGSSNAAMQSSAASDAASTTLGVPSNSPSGITALSCSAFAKGEGDDPTRLTRQYLTACLASTQFIPPQKMLKFLQDKSDLSEDMKVRLKVTERYYQNSQLAWVKSNKLPEAHRSHPLVREMDVAYRTLSDSNDPSLRQTKEDPNVLRILEGSIGFLCTLYDDVRNLIEYKGVSQLNEAVCRRYVDRLIDHFFNTPINPAVDVVTGLDFEKTAVIWSSHEQYIGLPRNEFQSLRSDDIIFSTRAAITELTVSGEEFTSLTREWRQAMINTPDKLYTDAIWNTVQVYQEASQPEACSTMPTVSEMTGQYFREPYQAICDSTVSIYIPDVFPTLDPARSFNMLTPPSGAIPADELDLKKAAKLLNTNPDSMEKASAPSNNTPESTPIVPKPTSKIPDLWAVSQVRTMSISKQANCLAQATLIGTSAVTPEAGATSMTKSVAYRKGHDLRRDLALTFVTFEDKRAFLNMLQAANQNRIYGSSNAKMFAVLGMLEMEMYGFIVKGFEVMMTASYAEKIRTKKLRSVFQNPDSISQVTILDGNAITFDLTDAVQLVNFAVTLIRLRVEHVPKVLHAFGLKNLEQINELPDIARDKMKGVATWKRETRQKPRKVNENVVVTSHE